MATLLRRAQSKSSEDEKSAQEAIVFHTQEALIAEADYRRERIMAAYEPVSSDQRAQRRARREHRRLLRHAFDRSPLRSATSS